jgi:hypothetical protein
MSFNVERLLQNHEGILKLSIGLAMFIFLYGAISKLDQKVNLIGNITQDLELANRLKNDAYNRDDMISDLASSEKFRRIYMGNMVLEINDRSANFLPFNESLKNQLQKDNNNTVVSHKLSKGLDVPIASYNEAAGTVEFHNKWEMNVVGQNDPWLSNFPIRPFLAYNSEIIPWPTCADDKKPSIAAEPVVAIGKKFQGNLIIKEFDKIKSWQVAFEGVDLMDLGVVQNQRALVIWTCS